MNLTEEYKYDKGLYYNNYRDNLDEESDKSDSDVYSEKDSDSDCDSDRNSVMFRSGINKQKRIFHINSLRSDIPQKSYRKVYCYIN